MTDTADQSNTARTGVYASIRVLDFSMFLAGPYCSRLMADMGAEVLKVEPPSGDFLRATPPVRDGRSAYFGHLNCGKKSICLDLKHPEGVTAVQRLAPTVDVLLENFRPGVMTRLGLGYEAMAELNPSLIYCSVTGYGQQGPNASLPSFAPIIHAASGFELLIPRYDPEIDRPVQNRNAAADYLAATHALAGIGAALFHRALTGEGQHIDVALMDTMHHAMSYEYTEAQFPGNIPPPTFRPLATRDGHIAIAPVSEGNFHGLARAAGRPEWITDPRFSDRRTRVQHWDELYDVIERWTRTVSSAEAEAALRREGCPASTYRTIAQAQLDPHVEARGAAVEVADDSGSFRVANCPMHFSRRPARARPRIPNLGESSDEILAEVGYTPENIARLREWSGALVQQ